MSSSAAATTTRAEELAAEIKAWKRRFTKLHKRLPEKRDLSPGIERVLSDYKKETQRIGGKGISIHRGKGAEATTNAPLPPRDQEQAVRSRPPEAETPRQSSPPAAAGRGFVSGSDSGDDSSSDDDGSHVSATPEPGAKHFCFEDEEDSEAESRPSCGSPRSSRGVAEVGGRHRGLRAGEAAPPATTGVTAAAARLGQQRGGALRPLHVNAPRGSAAAAAAEKHNPFLRKPPGGGSSSSAGLRGAFVRQPRGRSAAAAAAAAGGGGGGVPGSSRRKEARLEGGGRAPAFPAAREAPGPEWELEGERLEEDALASPSPSQGTAGGAVGGAAMEEWGGEEEEEEGGGSARPPIRLPPAPSGASLLGHRISASRRGAPLLCRPPPPAPSQSPAAPCVSVQSPQQSPQAEEPDVASDKGAVSSQGPSGSREAERPGSLPPSPSPPAPVSRDIISRSEDPEKESRSAEDHRMPQAPELTEESEGAAGPGRRGASAVGDAVLRGEPQREEGGGRGQRPSRPRRASTKLRVAARMPSSDSGDEEEEEEEEEEAEGEGARGAMPSRAKRPAPARAQPSLTRKRPSATRTRGSSERPCSFLSSDEEEESEEEEDGEKVEDEAEGGRKGRPSRAKRTASVRASGSLAKPSSFSSSEDEEEEEEEEDEESEEEDESDEEEEKTREVKRSRGTKAPRKASPEPPAQLPAAASKPPNGRPPPRPRAAAAALALPSATTSRPLIAAAHKRGLDFRAAGGAANQALKQPTKPNFVRTYMKGKRGTGFSYKLQGGKTRPRRGGVAFRDGPPLLPQAGDCPELDGAEACAADRGGCFRCGSKGHWARDCPEPPPSYAGAASRGLIPQRGAPSGEPLGFPQVSALQQVPQEDFSEVLEDPTEERLQGILREKFGHESFRGRQLQVIQQVLAGESTLAVLPTGNGKSLCYQLPALLVPGLCLVVSPLIALMKDQLERLPPCLPGAMLVSGQTKAGIHQILADAARGLVRVLFVSPERLQSALLLKLLAQLPPLSMVCVDEAHCVAEWGHNFRPAFYRLGHMLTEGNGLRLRCVLGLTATATHETQESVCGVLGIPESQVIREAPLRENLRLGVLRSRGGANSKASYRTVASLLLGPLRSARTIVYCSFQWHAKELAQTLFVSGVQAVCYHAGVQADERSRIQAQFCSGSLRVICATVAFGMGVDAQVDAVIHAAMPRSPEEYVQQIGRAGRNGDEAQCLLMLDDEVFLRLRSLAHMDCAEAEAVDDFLHKVFSKPPRAKDSGGGRGRKKRARKEEEEEEEDMNVRILPRKSTSVDVDMKEEVMETVLACLQGDEHGYIRVLPDTVSRLEVAFYSTSPQELAKEQPIVAAVLKAAGKKTNKKGNYSMSMADVSRHSKSTPSQVLVCLQELAATQELSFDLGSVKAFAYEVVEWPDDISELAVAVADRLRQVEESGVKRIDASYRAFASALAAKGPDCNALRHEAAEGALRRDLTAYFEPEGASGSPAVGSGGGDETGHRGGSDGSALPFAKLMPQIRGDVHALNRLGVGTIGGRDLSVRAIARILHGLPSPGCPADRFKEGGSAAGSFWGRYQGCDFQEVMAAVEEELSCKAQETKFEEERTAIIDRNKAMMDRLMMDADGKE